VRIVDTLAAAVGGYSDAPCTIARELALEMRTESGSTLLGTRARVSPDLAAFVNATAARAAEMNDVYHRPGSRNGHPSDVIMPLLSVAEYTRATGPQLIAAVVLAYEVYLRFADVALNKSFDAANFCCLGTAAGAGKLLGLDATRLAHCISLAAIPNNALNQTRTGQLTMWKSAAAGQAGRAGVFAAMLAHKGMEGPYLPFTGKHGWCSHIARDAIALDTLGGDGAPYKIHESFVKPRSACLHTLAPILAAEKVAASLKGATADIERVTVAVYQAKERSLGAESNTLNGGAHHWNPDSRETADHSIPYCVAATLLDGTVTPRSFDDARMRDPALRALLQKVQLEEHDEFTSAYEGIPVQYRSRVTAVSTRGERLVGETGGPHGDLSDAMSEAQVSRKFRGLVEPALGADATQRALDALRHLEASQDVSAIPALFAGVGTQHG
jgi:2-methylcitrate dehydratase